jgi:hypothetical protein
MIILFFVAEEPFDTNGKCRAEKTMREVSTDVIHTNSLPPLPRLAVLFRFLEKKFPHTLSSPTIYLYIEGERTDFIT